MTTPWRNIILLLFTGIFIINGMGSCISAYVKYDNHSEAATDGNEGQEINSMAKKEAENPDLLFRYLINAQVVIAQRIFFRSFNCHLPSQYYIVPTPPPWTFA